MPSTATKTVVSDSVAGIEVWRPTLTGTVAYRGSGVTHRYPRHWHDELHLCLYSSGSGYLGCRGTSRQVVSGDFVITPPGEVHENWVDDARGISFRSLYLPQPLFSKVAHQVTGRAAANPQFPEMLVADAAIKESFLRLHCSLEETQSDGGSRLQQEDLLLQFLHLLITRGSDAHATSQALKRERHAVRRVREYIQEHFSGSIALTDLAGLANLSPFHLHRVFALETGMPPHAYQTLLRVNRAKDLLRAGWRLSEVALATGFADQSHLTRHFRRLVGTTPGRFTADRKNVQDTPAHA